MFSKKATIAIENRVLTEMLMNNRLPNEFKISSDDS
jgi:hypothetical protein